MQTAIRCTLMRGGTSKGAYFLANDLPMDPDVLVKVLAAAMGSPDFHQLNGIGGGTSISSKVAIISSSNDDNADVDYLFGQVTLGKESVDFSPSCGNILAGVGPFAIEAGLVRARDEETVVRIRNVNTNSFIDAVVQTPCGRIISDGNVTIAGIVGAAAPITLIFKGVVGSKTGALLPTGNPIDVIQGFEVSCVDAAVPMVIFSAESLGKFGDESKEELDADVSMLAKMESVRREAGNLMGLGDVSNLVIPKMGMLSRPRKGGSITSRYFVPQNCHASHAVTGAICVATASLIENSVAYRVAEYPVDNPVNIQIEHTSGMIDIRQNYRRQNGELLLESSGVIRTARKLFTGEVFIPRTVWEVPLIESLSNSKSTKFS